MAEKNTKSVRVEDLMSGYRAMAILCLCPAVGFGVWNMLILAPKRVLQGRFLAGMVVLATGLMLLGGAFLGSRRQLRTVYRGFVVAAFGAAAAVALLALGKLMGKMGLRWTLLLGVMYLGSAALILGAHALTGALEAFDSGERDVDKLRRIPGATFATVERGVTFVVEVGLLLVVVVLLNWFKVSPGQFKRHDLSSLKPGQRVYALSSKTRTVLKNLKRDVNVIVFMTPPATMAQDSIYEDVKELLTRFSSLSGRLRVEYIDLHRQRQRAAALVSKYRLNLAEAVDLESGIGGLVVFVCGKKQKYVNSNDMADYDFQRGRGGPPTQKVKAFKAEAAFLNALLTVTQTEQFRICFTKGHGEADIESSRQLGYRYLIEVLKRENLQVQSVEKLAQRVPRRCDVLTVAGARITFSEREREAVRDYLKAGGKLFFLAAPAEAVGSTVRFAQSGLEGVLKEYGVSVEDAFALDLSIRAVRNPLIWVPDKTWGNHPITKVMQGKRMVLEMPRVIRAEKGPSVVATELLKTTTGKHAWGEKDLSFLVDPRAVPAYKEGVDIKSPVSVGVAARENKKGGARIVAFGSFINLANLHISPNQPQQDFSVDFFLNAIAWLGEKEQMIALRPRTPERVKLELRADQVNRIFRITVLGLPMLGILLGLLIWWVRRS